MVSGTRGRGLTPINGDLRVNLSLTRTFDSCEHRRRRIVETEASGAAR